MSFDKVAALYVYAANYHDGQTSRLYSLMGRISNQYRLQLSDGAWHGIRKGFQQGKAPSENEWYEANSYYRAFKAARLGQ